jgi:hypothetical protein
LGAFNLVDELSGVGVGRVVVVGDMKGQQILGGC